MIEKIKIFIWTLLNLPKIRFRYWNTRKIRCGLHIMNSYDTIEQIITNNYSVCRFGDGELQMLSHFMIGGNVSNFEVDTFQNYDTQLAMRLKEIYQTKREDVLICLPFQFKDAAISTLKARTFWEREWLGRMEDLQKLGLGKSFGDTNFTRFYLHRKDINDYPDYLKKLKAIWANRKVVIVEGELSRLGVGNDFFNTVISIERIICPSTNAFSKYNEILSCVKKIDPSKLILVALGHTATVLAYDLANLGYQAIDIGHIDIEYEWYKMGAKSKVAIPNKYVNEVSEGRINEAVSNEKYEKQIIDRII